MKPSVRNPLRFTRFTTSGAAPVAVAADTESPVDPTGGDFGAGLIKGVSVLCRGEALGHQLWVDGDMLSQCADAINSAGDGVKSRFTHPSMSSDGLAQGVGRSKNASVDGDHCVAEKHLWQSSHDTPDGDLGGYLMQRAQEDPASFGTSIVFDRDTKAEQDFMLANGGELAEDDDGYPYIKGFQSPDPDNANNYPHARIGDLRAVDFVDDPAANPEGLFHSRNLIPKEADALLSFALGLPGAERPEVTSFDVDPDRAAGFVARFLTQHQLELVPIKKETPMQDTHGESGAAEALPALSEAAEPVALSAPETKTGKDYMEAFGTEQGAIWFASGLNWIEAEKQHVGKLTADLAAERAANAELRANLASLRGESEPVSFTGEQPDKERQALAAQKYSNKLPEGLARFAAAVELPTAGKS